MMAYLPNYYYGDTADYIESYYLLSSDSSAAYGWVHNINMYWYNHYYMEYTDVNHVVHAAERYYKCDSFPQPETSFTLSNFIPSHTYYIYFFKTRIGDQSLPSTDTIVSDALGHLLIDLLFLSV